jgi:hypothetical protein
MKKIGPIALVACLGFLVLGFGLIYLQGTQVNAQVATEICDNKIDDDGDKLIDCEDPDCKCTPTGTPCSPGYWKNHTDAFNSWCGQVSGWTCDQLWTAVTCKGSNASCRRQEAALALDAVSGCYE